MTGRDLRTLREACGVTREQLDSALGWMPGAVAHWEGQIVPDTRAALDILRAVARLVRGSGKPAGGPPELQGRAGHAEGLGGRCDAAGFDGAGEIVAG